MAEYTRYLRPYLARETSEKGIPYLIPRLDLTGPADLLHLMRYFDFILVAYPDQVARRSYFVEIDPGSGSVSFERHSDFRMLGSRSVITLRGSYFERLEDSIESRQDIYRPEDGNLVIAFVPRGTFQTRYLQWKMLKVCRDNGHDPQAVSHCTGSFRKTRFGAWVFLIEDIVKRDGTPASVKDFEQEKVFGS